jgi:hypothetical protein
MYTKAHTITAYNYKDNTVYLNLANWLSDNGLSLTGSTITLKVSNSITAGSELFLVTQADHTGEGAGITTVLIPSATIDDLASGAYFYELSITTSAPETYTITQSDFIVGQSIKTA